MTRDTWHCAGWSSELACGPIGRTLLGRRLVLFRDASGTPRALGARCPHRGADLTRGAVVDGCIQCPFHGWRFDGLGQCTRIPSQPEGIKIPAPARVPTFALHEQQGVLWIWMGSGQAPHGEPPRYPLGQPNGFGRRLSFAPELVDAPFLDVVENTFDKAHVPFIHRGTFGPDQDDLVARPRITVDPDGRSLRA